MIPGDESQTALPQTLRQLIEGPQLSDLQVMELGLAVARALVQGQRRGRFGVQLRARRVLVFDDGAVRVAGLDGKHGMRQPQPSAPRYMAPEQWRGQDSGGAAQIWALGVLLHEMLCGRHPLGEAPELDPDGLRLLATAEEPLTLDPGLVEVAPRLRQLVSACLERDPEQRPSAEVVVVHLTAMIEQCEPGHAGGQHQRRRTFGRLQQLEQQRVRPRRSALGLLVGGSVVALASWMMYRGLVVPWTVERGARRRSGGHARDASRAEPPSDPPGIRQPAPGGETKAAQPPRADAGADTTRPAPDAREAKNKTKPLYPTSTPGPASVPFNPNRPATQK